MYGNYIHVVNTGWHCTAELIFSECGSTNSKDFFVSLDIDPKFARNLTYITRKYTLAGTDDGTKFGYMGYKQGRPQGGHFTPPGN